MPLGHVRTLGFDTIHHLRPPPPPLNNCFLKARAEHLAVKVDEMRGQYEAKEAGESRKEASGHE